MLKYLILLSAILINSHPLSADTILKGTKTYVIDGDTIRLGGTKVRLWGLHVPELGTAQGEASRAFLNEYISGQTVKCVVTTAKSYDRKIGSCFVRNVDIASVIILNGFGRDCPRFSKGAYLMFEPKSVKAWPLPSYC